MILEINMTKSSIYIYIQIRRKDDDIILIGGGFFFCLQFHQTGKKKGLKAFERVCLGGVKKKTLNFHSPRPAPSPGRKKWVKKWCVWRARIFEKKKRKKIYEEEFILEKKNSGPLLYVVYNSLHKNTNTYFLFFPKKAQGHTPSLPSI